MPGSGIPCTPGMVRNLLLHNAIFYSKLLVGEGGNNYAGIILIPTP